VSAGVFRHAADAIVGYRLETNILGVLVMSAKDQSRHFDRASLTSGLAGTRLADILWGSRHVSKVPISENVLLGVFTGHQ
jgi:hypothetical protein